MNCDRRQLVFERLAFATLALILGSMAGCANVLVQPPDTVTLARDLK
jgi:hypothetical protein